MSDIELNEKIKKRVRIHFTLANILDYVNGFAKEHYDEVEFV